MHPLAIRVMREIGIDIAHHASKDLWDFLAREVRTVVTVCGQADPACPLFPGQLIRHHWPFDDPASVTGTEEQVLAEFRRVRDGIRPVFAADGAGLREGAA